MKSVEVSGVIDENLHGKDKIFDDTDGSWHSMSSGGAWVTVSLPDPKLLSSVIITSENIRLGTRNKNVCLHLNGDSSPIRCGSGAPYKKNENEIHFDFLSTMVSNIELNWGNDGDNYAQIANLEFVIQEMPSECIKRRKVVVYEPKQMTLQEAFNTCESLPGAFQLPIPLIENEHEFFSSHSKDQSAVPIGITEPKKGSWLNIYTGEVINYFNWAQDEPWGDGHHAEIHGVHKLWNDINNHVTKLYTVICVEPVPSNELYFFEDITLEELTSIKRRVIVHEPKEMTWKESFDKCRSLPGVFQLSVPVSEAENEFFRSLAKSTFVPIGISDEINEGTWQNYYTGEIINYRNWVDDNRSASHHYAELSSTGVWSDITIDQKRFFTTICVELGFDSEFYHFEVTPLDEVESVDEIQSVSSQSAPFCAVAYNQNDCSGTEITKFSNPSQGFLPSSLTDNINTMQCIKVNFYCNIRAI